MDAEALLDKMRALPDARVAEVEDFAEFLIFAALAAKFTQAA